MSNMDLYKKKYKEAMDRMELCVRSGLKISPEYIFPELAENKDERIRKALKQYFVNSFQNNGVAAICGVHVKDVLAWLEKQCQVNESAISQHEIETCKENNNSLTSEDEKVRKALLEMVHDTTGDELWVDYGVHKEEALAWLEKQEGCEYIKKDWLEHIKQSWYKEGLIDGKYSGGTSKEWTINDAATLKELIGFLENGTAKLQHDLTRYANWLKNQFTLIEKQNEQKPTNSYCQDCTNRKGCVNCENGELRETEQKTEENKGNIVGISSNWSEEDERLCQCLIEDQEEFLDRVINDKYGHSEIISDLKEIYHKRIDWLKSLKGRLKPQNRWKPSDEQIKVCKEVYADLLSAKGFDLGTVVSELNRLEEGLKKKGE